MKIYALITILSLTTTALASFVISPNFRSSKNVMFSCLYGGTSHVNWVLDILDELSSRGHSTFYTTTDEQVNFSKNYPSIITQSIGPTLDSKRRSDVARLISSQPPTVSFKSIIDINTDSFPSDFAKLKEIIISNKIDILICDSVNRPCMEAANSLDIPFVVTSAFTQGKDARTPYINNDFATMKIPTTEFMSLKDRLVYKFVLPFKYALMLRKSIHNQMKMFKSLNIKPSLHAHQKYEDRIKIFNTAFGFEQGRPIGPLVEFVGPILPKNYSSLTPDINQFLESHRRVAYIAFGQTIVASEADGKLILTGLLEALEYKYIDGIIWTTRGNYDMFPSYITTKSNTTYDIQSFHEKSKNILLLNWAPQMAILHHPSTNMFVTHGGAASMYEAAYAGVRIVVYPFCGDQYGAAVTSEKNGIGLHLDKTKSQINANEVIGRVARDMDGEFQANINRFKALTQIKAERGVARGADIVEEAIFVQKDGHVAYRWDVKRNMSFIKANNIDLYAIVLTFIVCFGYSCCSLMKYLIIKRKQKTL